jgi:hypothetical protein
MRAGFPCMEQKMAKAKISPRDVKVQLTLTEAREIVRALSIGLDDPTINKAAHIWESAIKRTREAAMATARRRALRQQKVGR